MVTQLYYHYDEEGYFNGVSEFIEGEEAPENATLEVWEEPCFKPKFDGSKWIDANPQPLDDEYFQIIEEIKNVEAALKESDSNE